MEKLKQEIDHFVGQIVSRFNPERIVLFGSHARGRSSMDSDVDLLVIMDFEGRPHEKAFEIRKAIPRKFPLDLLVRRQKDIDRRLQMNDLFFKEILQKGKTLYERSGGRMV
jgi:predicted nucleotidyltransferase